jgi:hypothetical protein
VRVSLKERKERKCDREKKEGERERESNRQKEERVRSRGKEGARNLEVRLSAFIQRLQQRFHSLIFFLLRKSERERARERESESESESERESERERENARERKRETDSVKCPLYLNIFEERQAGKEELVSA